MDWQKGPFLNLIQKCILVRIGLRMIKARGCKQRFQSDLCIYMYVGSPYGIKTVVMRQGRGSETIEAVFSCRAKKTLHTGCVRSAII